MKRDRETANVTVDDIQQPTKKKKKKQLDSETAPRSEIAQPKDDAAHKKRAWRTKVRREARKLALKQAQESLASATNDSERQEASRIVEKTRVKRKKKPKSRKTHTTDEEETPDGDAAANAVGSLEVAGNGKEVHPLLAARFRLLNERLYSISSEEAQRLFTDEPDAFEAYHQGYKSQTKKWDLVPAHHALSWLAQSDGGRSLSIGDFGCGEALIAKKASKRHTVHSFDLVATNDRVTVASMENVPLEDQSLDVAIFCLSLMNTNVVDFVREANRCLKVGGHLLIAEVTSRFDSITQFCKAVNRLGFKLESKRKLSGDYFTWIEFTKTSSSPSAEKRLAEIASNLTLKPCLYKRR